MGPETYFTKTQRNSRSAAGNRPFGWKYPSGLFDFESISCRTAGKGVPPALANSRLTIMVIPETGRRPFSFKFTPYWFALVGLLIGGVAYMVNNLYQETAQLRAQVSDLAELQVVNRLQQAEIEAMTVKAQETQEQLERLYSLEEQIQQLTGVGATVTKASRSGSSGDIQIERGRGGPSVATSAASPAANVPTLAALLPADVAAHLFSKRDTLPLHLQRIQSYERNSEQTLAKAEDTLSLMDAQIESMNNLSATLNSGKEAIVDRLEFLAHRPTGIPIAGAAVTDRFGWRQSPFGWGGQPHNGIDLAQAYWTPIVSTGAGVVVHAGWKSGGFGYAVIIDHGYGYQTLYAHMIDWDVRVGQEVVRGTRLGWVGSSGLSTGPHLHYEVHKNGVPVDPSTYLQ